MNMNTNYDTNLFYTPLYFHSKELINVLKKECIYNVYTLYIHFSRGNMGFWQKIKKSEMKEMYIKN